MPTVTVKPQVAVLPAVSVAVQVTFVVPALNVDPDGGVQVVVTPGQLSLAVGEKATGPGAGLTTLAGQVMVGGCVSFTVTVNEQLAPVTIAGPAPPVGFDTCSEQLTVVVPTGKNEPEGGEQVTVPHVPDVVGAG